MKIINRIGGGSLLLATLLGGQALILSSHTMAATPLVKLTYDEANGSTSIADVIGGGAYNINVIHNPAERVPGVSGNALRTDGYSTWATGAFAPTGNSAITNQFAVSTWVALESYPSTEEGNHKDSALLHQISGSNGFRVGINTYGQWWLDVNIGGTLQRVNAPAQFPLYSWTHVAATVNAGLVKLYINGVQVASQQFASGNLVLAPGAAFTVGRSDQPQTSGVFEVNAINAAYDNTCLYKVLPTAAELLAEYNAGKDASWRDAIAVPDSRFADDNLRPKYHAMPPANWTNEPHGLVRYNNRYHMFYQRTPNGPYKWLMHWGHMVSDDLVNWENLQDALYPQQNTSAISGLGSKGIWSGNVVVNGDTAHAFYTTVNYDGKYDPGVAWSTSNESNIEHWVSKGGIIDKNNPNPGAIGDFRDPYVWKQGNLWHMIIGTDRVPGSSSDSGGVEHYTNSNIDSSSWVRASQPFVSIPFANMDIGSEIWEMPVFEFLGTINGQDKYILVVSPIGGAMRKTEAPYVRSVYWTGTWNATAANGAGQFVPDYSEPKMLDVIHGHLSPTITRTPTGELVAIGIVDERTNSQMQNDLGWAHTYGLPRVWRLLADGQTLGQTPAASLTSLRLGSPVTVTNQNVTGETTLAANGNQVEIIAQVNPAQTGASYGLTISASPDRDEYTRIYYDGNDLVIDKTNSTNLSGMEEPGVYKEAYDEVAFGKPQKWQVFIDHSVISVFINDKAVFENRIYPARADSKQIALYSAGGTTAFTQVDVYQLKAADTSGSAKLRLQQSAPIVEHAENGATIDVFLSKNLFTPNLSNSGWSISGLPAGVSLLNVARVNDTQARLTLTGNSTTDYDTDLTHVEVQMLASQVQTPLTAALKASGVRLTAVVEPVTTITLQADGPLNEGSEAGQSITVQLTNNQFVSTLNPAQWTIANLPAGLSYSLQYVDAHTVRINLAGSAQDYDINIANLSVTIAPQAFVNADPELHGGTASVASGVTFVAFSGTVHYDFERGNLDGWYNVVGDAFTGLGISADANWWGGAFKQQGVYHYWGFNSGEDASLGSMRTGNFVLEGDGKIRYLIAGGNNMANLYLAVIRACDGVELFRDTGTDTETYSEKVIDAHAYIGQTLYLKAVDNFTGGWGHLNLDDIRVPVADQLDGILPTNIGSGCSGSSSSAATSSAPTSSSTPVSTSSSKPSSSFSSAINSSANSSSVVSSSSKSSSSTATSSATSSAVSSSSSTGWIDSLRVYDFESGGLENWTITGTAFSAADISTTTTFWDNQPFNQQGARHLWSFQSGGDDLVGTITTQAFVLGGDGQIRFKISGGTNLAQLYLALVRVSDGVELLKVTGNNSEGYVDTVMNASAYLGQNLKVRLVDNATGGFGHINLDYLRIPERIAGSSSSASSVITSSSSAISSSSSTPVSSSSVMSSSTSFSSSSSSSAPVLVYDFESGGLESWTVTGSAFSAADISTTTTFWDNQPFNQQGARHLWSFQSGGDELVGTITTQAFILGGDGQIRFKLSGGNNIAQLYLALVRVSDGVELLKVTGNNSEGYADITMNAAAYLGETLKVRLVDNATGGFGHINLDYLRIPTGAASTIQTYNFESGNLQGWTVLGDAFSAGDVASEACYWAECVSFNREGNFHLWGFKVGGDVQTGELRSAVFTLAGNGKINLLLGGGNNIDLLYVALVDAQTGLDLVKITGADSETLSARVLDASAFLGRRCYLRVMDKSTAGFGHLNLDNVQIPVAL